MAPQREKTEKHRAECRKDLHCTNQSIVSGVVIASVYKDKDAFGKACAHTAADATGPKTWGTRYCGHDEHATLWRQRFLSAGTKGISRTLLMAASAILAVGAGGAGGGPAPGAGVVVAGAAPAADRKFAARLMARGLFSPEGEEHRGPVLEKARKRFGRLYPNLNFGFSTASTHQFMTGLAYGTPKLQNALPEETPAANCKWGWVTTYVCKKGILGNQFDCICDAEDAIRSTLQEMDVAICVEIKISRRPHAIEQTALQRRVDGVGRGYSAASTAWRSRRWRGTELQHWLIPHRMLRTSWNRSRPPRGASRRRGARTRTTL